MLNGGLWSLEQLLHASQPHLKHGSYCPFLIHPHYLSFYLIIVIFFTPANCMLFIIHYPFHKCIYLHHHFIIPCSCDTGVLDSWSAWDLFRFVGITGEILLMGSGGALLASNLMGMFRRAENLGSNFLSWVMIAVDEMVNWNNIRNYEIQKRFRIIPNAFVHAIIIYCLETF